MSIFIACVRATLEDIGMAPCNGCILITTSINVIRLMGPLRHVQEVGGAPGLQYARSTLRK
eukprot:9499633-Karenia_brevis.AAC.1